MKYTITLIFLVSVFLVFCSYRDKLVIPAPERPVPPSPNTSDVSPRIESAPTVLERAEAKFSGPTTEWESVIDEPDSSVLSIGEPMDPDDPSTWPQSENAEVINIGEPLDPDDPSTWPQSDSTEVINIGEPMDPDDPSTWPQSDSTEVINVGEPMDPDDPSTWPQSQSTEVINIGEPMDLDDPSTRPN